MIREVSIKQSFRFLAHISRKNLTKAIHLWIKHMILKQKRDFTPNEKTIKNNFGTNLKKHLKNNSPISPGHRLFQKAQEIELRKSETRKSLIPEYPFTPRISSSTQKWLDSKIRKEFKEKAEEVAIVSGSKAFEFDLFKDKIDPKLQNLAHTSDKNRIILERKDIKSTPSYSPTKIPRHNSSSIPKFKALN